MTHLGDLISAWLDGELAPGDRAAADRHLAGCTECRAELAIVEAGRTALRGLPVHHPLPVVAPPPLRRRWRLSPAPAWITAALAAVLAVGLWIGPGEADAAFQMDVLDDQHTARVVGDPGISTFRGEQP